MTCAGSGKVRQEVVTARRFRGQNLWPRVVSALVMATAALVAAALGGPVFLLFWLAAGLAILWEWQGLVARGQGAGPLWPGVAAVVAVAVLSSYRLPAEAAAALALGAAAAGRLAAPGRRLVAACGPLYAGALVGATVLLRQSRLDGYEIVIWLFAVVWGTDTFAFFGGRLIGGPRLAPRISPSKTWSGFGIGVVGGAVLGLLVAPRSDYLVCTLASGLAAGMLAQAGDLLESALKRRFGAKDAGRLIPGHGGVMDRLDGFIAASVFAAAVGLWRFGPADVGAGLLKW